MTNLTLAIVPADRNHENQSRRNIGADDGAIMVEGLGVL